MSQNLRPWPKGVSGNPGGKSSLPEELRGVTSLSQHEVTKIVSRFARMSRAELQATVEDQRTTMLDLSIASVFAQAAKHGDFTRLGWLLDRAIGKVPAVEIQADPMTPFAALTDEELLSLVRGKPKELDAG